MPVYRYGKSYPHDAGAPSVAVENISVQYNGHKALDGITFELVRGERVAVVGPNGAGKSTLFKVLAGVLAPQTGRVRLYGGEPSQHICVGYVPQRSQIDLTFPATVRDVVLMGRYGKIGLLRWPGRRDHRLVEECLQVVNMVHLAHRQIGELSGGQQQRVFVARALAQEAEIMLMDEPFTGLDVSSQEDIMHILDELTRRHVTVLVATHDLNQAASCFTRVMVLNHRLVAFGPPDEVFTSDLLREAYGDQLRLVETANGALALSNIGCCGGQQ